MRQQMRPLTAALLLLVLQTVATSCRDINTNVVSAGTPFDQSRLQIPGGYQKEPVHWQALNPGLISAECKEDLQQLLNVTSPEFKEESLALDAFGKPEPALLEGNTAWLGSYDECMGLEEFKYCLADMVVIRQKQSSLAILWGVCPPVSCSDEDVKNALQDLIGVLGKLSPSFDEIHAAAVTCTTSPPIPYNAGFYCTVILLGIIGLLMIGGALYAEYLKFTARQKPDSTLDIKQGEDTPLLQSKTNQSNASINHALKAPKGLFGKILLCFAVTLNLSKLLDTRQKDSSISSLNGIRFISMTWVILGHTFFFAIIYRTLENPYALLNWLTEDFGFQAVANAFFAVDTFFFLSGCLVCYITLSRMEELKSVKAWLWFYFHRYWRLTPVLIVTILIFLYIEPFFGDGPVWQSTSAKSSCQKYWWTNLLYINNFYPQIFNQECLAWTWYLANDMQFFIISPLILVPLYYSPILGWIILCALTISSMVTTGILMGVYDLTVNFEDQIIPKPGSDPGLSFSSVVYAKPYCRIAPYLVGVGLGYIMHRIGKRKIKVSPLLAVTGWVLAVGIGMSIVYGLYPSYHSGKEIPKATNIAYASLSRFGWGVAIAWVVFACKYGYGGWVNSFLSWTGWVPLSRLTYCAYMFHPIVLSTFYRNFGTGIYLSKYLVAFYFAGCLAISYFLAMLISLAVEFPFANLEKLFMPDNPREKQERSARAQNTHFEDREA